MKVTEVSYSRLSNIGDYEHKKIGVTVSVEPGDSPAKALASARDFVEKALARPALPGPGSIEHAERVIANCDKDDADPDRQAEWMIEQRTRQRRAAQAILDMRDEANSPFEEFV